MSEGWVVHTGRRVGAGSSAVTNGRSG
jgi:hypothetical protein